MKEMPRDKFIENFVECFDNLFDDDKIEVYNNYCKEWGFEEDMIYYNDDEFYDTFSNPHDLLEAAFGGDFRLNDKFVRLDGYGGMESFMTITDNIDVEEMAEWAYDTNCNLEKLGFDEDNALMICTLDDEYLDDDEDDDND